jgi:hypothetical protein
MQTVVIQHLALLYLTAEVAVATVVEILTEETAIMEQAEEVEARVDTAQDQAEAESAVKDMREESHI